MVGATATATEMQNNFGKYLNMVINGNLSRTASISGRNPENMVLFSSEHPAGCWYQSADAYFSSSLLLLSCSRSLFPFRIPARESVR